jgi:hypothetical protein
MDDAEGKKRAGARSIEREQTQTVPTWGSLLLGGEKRFQVTRSVEDTNDLDPVVDGTIEDEVVLEARNGPSPKLFQPSV